MNSTMVLLLKNFPASGRKYSIISINKHMQASSVIYTQCSMLHIPFLGKHAYSQTIFYYRNGYSLEIALLLSVFLGMFGLDRFYLGYPGIGLAKLCTLGFMFLGQLLDIILIAAQVCIVTLTKKIILLKNKLLMLIYSLKPL